MALVPFIVSIISTIPLSSAPETISFVIHVVAPTSVIIFVRVVVDTRASHFFFCQDTGTASSPFSHGDFTIFHKVFIFLSVDQAYRALELVLADIPRAAFTVHRFKPEDFLIVFAAPEFKESVLRRSSLPFSFFTLFFRQWTRQAQASLVRMRSKVRLEIEGVPPHAWEKEIVQQLVGESCSLDALAPETASRADLSVFRAEAWTADLEAIPTKRELWVPEPSACAQRSGSSRHAGSARRDRFLDLLKYDVLIHISRVEEFVSADDSDGASRRRPDQEGLGDDTEGFWTSRSLRWVPGVPDQRGGRAGDLAGDRHGGLPGARADGAWNRCWMLPHLESHAVAPQRILDPSSSSEEDRVGPSVQRADASVQPAPLPSADPGADPVGDSVSSFKADSVDRPSGELAAQELLIVGQVDRVLADRDSVDQEFRVVQDKEISNVADSQSPYPPAGYFVVELSEGGPQGVRALESVEGADAAGLNSDGPAPCSPGFGTDSGPSRTRSVTLDESYDGPNDQMQLVERVPDDEQRQSLAEEEKHALDRIKGFCATLLKKLAPPLLRELNTAKELRADAAPFAPRRVTRHSVSATAATPSKPPRKVSAADLVLLKTLGIASSDLEVNENHLKELNLIFDLPIREQHLRAIAAIYGATVPVELFSTGPVLQEGISA
ncbi:hypothetical protein QYE76_069341 [Lolium multiflorum]|uniref:DUF4283 domain-containing protein n=1 Tax=Lolium multiflorum TaxID=4521 RepID=A0AAD8SHK6_LOLMU|nr:hypothetical protein QYE76_069341 [Lolium multiflorum]